MEDPTNSYLRCGKWLLQSTKIRRSIGDKPFEGKPPGGQPLKRKQSSPSPTSLANSCTSENSVQLLVKVHTGLGWDAELKTVTAPTGVWDEIIKANSKNEKLCNKGIDHFELLDELLHNSMATGAFALPAPQFTIKETIVALDDIQGIVGDTQYWKAYGLMMGPEGPSWREGFMNHQSHNRIGWVSQLD
ncbi:hypothetical protein RHMOL_Rhmol05G0124200 [Rhododendron molle]|uniref:Uncharacterized protein n=1 Tax=Rhododendron molle TaxID=49168 RepID=A0ACC0NPB8_RHOML|nr:hypothetical protein RHMOL_Rhmol05G0124200 [Rhododendron molle]